MERWVSNYKKVGERRLTQPERAAAERRRRGMGHATVPIWLTWSISLPGFFALCLLFDDPPGWVFLYLVVALAWLAYVPLKMRDARRAAAAAVADLEADTVEVFEWQAPWGDDQTRHLLEVLLPSGRVVAVDGKVPKRSTRVSVSEIALPTRSQAAAAFPRQMSFSPSADRIEPLRPLSFGEIEELKAFRTKLGTFPFLYAALMLSWLTMVCVSVATNPNDKSPILGPIVLGALIVLSWRHKIKMAALRAKLERDIQAATVEEKSPANYPHRPGARLPQVVEVLPFSNAVWTIEGEPAGWRKTV